MKPEFRLFALPSSEILGKNISKQLKVPLSKIKFTRFLDGEVLLSAVETVRNRDVFVVTSNSHPVNDNIMQLLIFIDSLKRASAKSITVVNTYYAYSRQDRKSASREPIAAKLMADLLQVAGVDRLITVDLHNPSIQGFFDLPVDDLKGQYIIASEIKKLGKFTIVSPDHGGAMRARILAELVSHTVHIAIIDKRRTGPNESETMNILGDVNGKNVVILDDMIDTGGTIFKAADLLKNAGAKKIVIAATHGIFSKGFDLFEQSTTIDQVIVTDSIDSVHKINSPKLKVVSLALFLARAIVSSIDGKSISEFYEHIKKKFN